MNQPWPIIVARYKASSRSLPAIRALQTVSEYICDSDLAIGLHGWMSMWDLCITQTRVTHAQTGPFLKISVLSANQLEFRYMDTQIPAEQWHRIVVAPEAIPRLLSFFDQLRWFPSEVLAPDAQSNQA